jgi:hypothetical protein
VITARKKSARRKSQKKDFMIWVKNEGIIVVGVMRGMHDVRRAF